MKINLSPIRIFAYYLSALMLIGSLSQVRGSLLDLAMMIRNFSLILGGAYGTYRILLVLKKNLSTRFEHRFITSVILFLLFYFDQPWYLFLGLGIGTEVLQRFVRFPTGPMMNPAALIALIATLIGFYPAWWGVNFSPRLPVIVGGVSVAVFLTVPLGTYVVYKYRKLKIAIAFLLTFTVFYLLLLRSNPLFILIEGTLLFFSLVMVIEPKTSPILVKEQLLYGIAMGILVPLAIYINFPETYLGPLVLCNLGFNFYRNRRYLSTKLLRRASPPMVPTTP